MTSSGRASGWPTTVGLTIALFAVPAISLLFKLAGFTKADSSAVVVRELIILALCGALLWIVRVGEELPMSSIGLKRQPIGQGIIWIVGVMVLFAGVLFLCLGVILPALGLTYGSGSGPAVSPLVTTLVVARAGIVEELFYRGYAIERIGSLTGSPVLAATIPLIIFAGAHFSQGAAGVLIALCVGAAATGIYMWKRNLVILIVAHFLLDFIPNVILPLLG